VFRALWIASVASNIGGWMQNVGATWLMTELTPSPVLVALLQTATSLPVFAVGLLAGALGDVVDRRRLLLLTQAWMLGVAIVLGATTLAGWMSPWLLLTLTFLLGLGAALNAPAWQAIIPELVGRRTLPAAVALNSAGFNLARAVGPALGGLVVAALGPGAVFLLNAASFVGVLVVIFRWRRAPRPPSDVPAERLLGAVQAGVRYARHAPELQAVLVRAGVFILAGSALWALLPVVARQELGLDASGYGVLLGSLGVGAVGGALLLPRLGRWVSVEQRVVGAALVFAGATVALALVHNLWVLNGALLAGGGAWMVLMSSLNVAAQTTTPEWVRARSLSVYLLVFQGGMALGSLAWGALAEQVGTAPTLLGAALAVIVGLGAAWRWRLPADQARDLSPSLHWPEPRLALTPQPDDGPVLVTVAYRVKPADATAFVEAMQALRRLRRRDGAIRWGLWRDSAAPEQYIETFVVPSWGEHLRQHMRGTVDDRETEAQARAWQHPDTPPVVTHYIAAHPGDTFDLSLDPPAATATPPPPAAP
jgi:MFS family permease